MKWKGSIVRPFLLLGLPLWANGHEYVVVGSKQRLEKAGLFKDSLQWGHHRELFISHGPRFFQPHLTQALLVDR